MGGTFLLATAIYFKLTYFIALEIILIAGHGTALLGLNPVLQIILPALLTLQLFIYYLFMGQLNSIFKLIGIIGIALLSAGLTYENQ